MELLTPQLPTNAEEFCLQVKAGELFSQLTCSQFNFNNQDMSGGIFSQITFKKVAVEIGRAHV